MIIMKDDGQGDHQKIDKINYDVDDHQNTGCFFSLGLPLKSTSMENQG